MDGFDPGLLRELDGAAPNGHCSSLLTSVSYLATLSPAWLLTMARLWSQMYGDLLDRPGPERLVELLTELQRKQPEGP